MSTGRLSPRPRVGLSLLPALLSLLASSAAWGQASRTWVSSGGDDINPCSRSAPCKTFAGTFVKTATGGEMDVLDPGGFGGLNVTRSITVDGGPNAGGILSAGVHGIFVNAPGAVVILRNLVIQGAGTGLDGIRIFAASQVHVENCTLMGFTGSGIHVLPDAGAVQLFVRNSSINGASSKPPAAPTDMTAGIHIESGSAVIDHVQAASAITGVGVLGTAQVTAHDLTLAGNTGEGIHATGSAKVTLERGVVAQNGTGIKADAPALVRISDVMVGHNQGKGLDGNVASYGNNRVAAGNGTDGSPATLLPQN
ncbi:right-handed parallel beta-helix repeat-containing protein [Myxococcaceae bacterium JPH2]|nr:right-handed parallel beta-helix repeat-containing protein [Myxococcaceae bacterium JPH2]